LTRSPKSPSPQDADHAVCVVFTAVEGHEHLAELWSLSTLLLVSEGYMLTSRLYFTIARLHVRKVYTPRTTLREAEGALLWQDTESVPVRFHPKLLIDLN
jgi:hypothetical protein